MQQLSGYAGQTVQLKDPDVEPDGTLNSMTVGRLRMPYSVATPGLSSVFSLTCTHMTQAETHSAIYVTQRQPREQRTKNVGKHTCWLAISGADACPMPL